MKYLLLGLSLIVYGLNGAQVQCENGPVIQTVLSYDIPLLKSLIEAGVSLEEQDELGNTPLMLATRYPEIIKILLSHKAYPTKKNRYGTTALMQAIMTAADYGTHEVVLLLLDAGANPNAQDNDGMSALMIAMARGDEKSVKILMFWGADASLRDMEGKVALDYAKDKPAMQTAMARGLQTQALWKAATNNDKKAVLKLLGAQIKPAVNRKEFQGQLGGKTILMWAAEHGYLDVAQSILGQGGDVNERDDNNQTALFYAIMQGKEEMVQFFLRHGADVNILATHYQVTPLALAASRGYLGIVKILKDAGGMLNTQDVLGMTPLMRATLGEHADVVAFLLQEGAQPHMNDQANNTALMYGILKGNVQIVRNLIEHAVDLDVKNNQGVTPLMFSVINNVPYISKLLVAAGADTEIKNEQEGNKRAIDYATERNRSLMLKIISQGKKERKKK